MQDNETEIDMVKRHIALGENALYKQRNIICRLKDRKLPTIEAETLLENFEHLQKMHEEHLARLEGKKV